MFTKSTSFVRHLETILKQLPFHGLDFATGDNGASVLLVLLFPSLDGLICTRRSPASSTSPFKTATCWTWPEQGAQTAVSIFIADMTTN